MGRHLSTLYVLGGGGVWYIEVHSVLLVGAGERGDIDLPETATATAHP
jgi:hypothetical protein